MENNLYLKEVSLSGYKSIIDVNVEFQNGINIIIGKNAAGKTNFLNFLNKSLSLNYDELNNFYSNLKLQNGKEISIESKNTLSIKELFNNSNISQKVESTLKISKKTIRINKDSTENSLLKKLRDNDVIFENNFICHGIPSNYLLIDKPFSFKIDKENKIVNDLYNLVSESSNPYFIKSTLLKLLVSIMNNNNLHENFSVENIKQSFFQVFENIEEIKSILKKYSPIEDIKFSDNFNVFINDSKDSITTNNLFLEFKIDGDWLPYSNLSDGTKRIFYIISEVYDINNDTNLWMTNTGLFYSQKPVNRIILIEEPELGIHPHQFHKLMEFLNEESQKKQIIITTHSPQALDSINPNELNRITIAYSTNSKEGTKLRHLNENEILKANEYIKEDFLSDYWLYSDLEK